MQQTILNRSRNDKFLLVLEIPPALKNIYDSALNKPFEIDNLQFTVFGTPVPAINVPNITLPYGGQNLNISSISRPAYPPLALKFLIDNGYQNYWMLWKWLDLFNDATNSVTELTKSLKVNDSIFLTNNMSDYTTTFSLVALDEYNNKIISFNYKQAFLTGLSEINYNYQEPSEISCTATFAYNQLDVKLLGDVSKNIC
jgi:hypothetical protein